VVEAEADDIGALNIDGLADTTAPKPSTPRRTMMLRRIFFIINILFNNVLPSSLLPFKRGRERE
jgi:hypothetical protein